MSATACTYTETTSWCEVSCQLHARSRITECNVNIFALCSRGFCSTSEKSITCRSCCSERTCGGHYSDTFQCRRMALPSTSRFGTGIDFRIQVTRRAPVTFKTRPWYIDRNITVVHFQLIRIGPDGGPVYDDPPIYTYR